MTVSLRVPMAEDYAAIASWITDAKNCARWAGPQLAFPFDAGSLPSLLTVPEGESYSLCDSGNPSVILGFGQYWERVPGVAHLGRIIVTPEGRGRGYGKALCDALIHSAVARRGVGKISLRVYRDNPAAMQVYHSLGFESVASESNEEIMFMLVDAERAVKLGSEMISA